MLILGIEKMFIYLKLWIERARYGSFNEIMSVFSILDGNIGDSILLSEIGSMKKQLARKKLGDYFKCPICGNPNLISKVWKGYIKSKSEQYEPYDSSTTAGKNYTEGLDKALQYSDSTIDDLKKILADIKQKTNENLYPEKLFRHKIYRSGFIAGINSLIEYRTSNTNQTTEIEKKFPLRL